MMKVMDREAEIFVFIISKYSMAYVFDAVLDDLNAPIADSFYGAAHWRFYGRYVCI